MLGSFKQKIKKLTLVPSGGGCFEVTVDGELIHSKLKSGEFPDEQTLTELVTARLKK